MTQSRTLHKSAETIFQSVLKMAESRFEIIKKDNEVGLQLLSQFSGLDTYERLYVHQITEFKSVSASFIILLLEKHLTIIKQTASKTRYQEAIEEVEPVLIFSLPEDIGKVVIQKETFGDRIAHLFLKADIDFEEYPVFSKNYQVVGDKPDLVKQHLPPRLMRSLEKFEGLIVEINGRLGIVRTEKNLTETVMLQLLAIGNQIIK
jgi:hypothetical protein